MSKWLKALRGMLGMGLTFSVGVGLVTSTIALIRMALFGFSPEVARVAVAAAVWAFPIGVVASGVLSLTSRHLRFDQLSLPRFAAFGALGGLALYGLLALNAWQAWTLDTAIVNGVLLVGIGTMASTASLLIARRSMDRELLEQGDEIDEAGLTDSESRELLGESGS